MAHFRNPALLAFAIAAAFPVSLTGSPKPERHERSIHILVAAWRLAERFNASVDRITNL